MSEPRRNYLPPHFTVDFETLQGFYEELLGREIGDAAALEQWLRDRSELEAALEENFAWRYIKMTCDTANEELRKDFEYFATEIEPRTAPYNDKLNRKLAGSAFREQLDKDKYFVYLRAVEKEIELFREENIPLFSQLQVEQQKYGAVTGAMTVRVNEQEYTLQQAANFLKDNRRALRQEVFEKSGTGGLRTGNSWTSFSTSCCSYATRWPSMPAMPTTGTMPLPPWAALTTRLKTVSDFMKPLKRKLCRCFMTRQKRGGRHYSLRC